MANTRVKSNKQIITHEEKIDHVYVESTLDEIELDRIESDIKEPAKTFVVNDRKLIAI